MIKYSNGMNTATIEEITIYPYMGAPKKEKAFRLTVSANYDNNFVYHISVYETMGDVKNGMKNCGFNI